MPASKEKIVANESGGAKGVKLAAFDKIPADSLWAIAERFGIGTAKYDNISVDGTGPAGSNWEKGVEFSKIFAGLQRHVQAAWGGEDVDAQVLAEGLAEELDIDLSDLNGSELHWAAVAWHAIVMLHFTLNYEHYKDFDDRSLISGFRD